MQTVKDQEYFGFVPGGVRAYFIEPTWDEGWMCVEFPDDVEALCGDDTFPLAGPEAMQPGEELEHPDWTVTCHQVDRDWLANLPQHPGW